MRCARKCRQTQNPERGRKLNNTFFERGAVESVVRPKTPRGDGNARNRPTWACPQRVVRPKTPRGDGNPTMASKSAWVTDPGRQTQNPERGRKLVRHLCLIQVQCPVVRPKTPRGDGNPHGGTWTSATIGVVGPKTPRGDGNWTQNRTGCGRCSRRQTQNPERGRKRISPATPQPRYCSMSSDPKPREGTETTTTGSPPRLLTGIQDEHDGGVDGEDVWS
ncbi:Uncharacterised protein [Mycobacterium tuberculosis]|nr:Uncharacterised protein [Mycobacterium tuberculosis]